MLLLITTMTGMMIIMTGMMMIMTGMMMIMKTVDDKLDDDDYDKDGDTIDDVHIVDLSKLLQ